MDVRDHLKAATSRASRTRAGAHALLEAGFPGPALVWAVRAAEELMRDFEPLTTEGDHAWEYWKQHIVVRGDIVHGRAVADVDEAEAREVLAFVERMATWYPQRFRTSGKHPLSHEVRELLAELAAQYWAGEPSPEEA